MMRWWECAVDPLGMSGIAPQPGFPGRVQSAFHIAVFRVEASVGVSQGGAGEKRQRRAHARHPQPDQIPQDLRGLLLRHRRGRENVASGHMDRCDGKPGSPGRQMADPEPEHVRPFERGGPEGDHAPPRSVRQQGQSGRYPACTQVERQIVEDRLLPALLHPYPGSLIADPRIHFPDGLLSGRAGRQALSGAQPLPHGGFRRISGQHEIQQVLIQAEPVQTVRHGQRFFIRDFPVRHDRPYPQGAQQAAHGVAQKIFQLAQRNLRAGSRANLRERIRRKKGPGHGLAAQDPGSPAVLSGKGKKRAAGAEIVKMKALQPVTSDQSQGGFFLLGDLSSSMATILRICFLFFAISFKL